MNYINPIKPSNPEMRPCPSEEKGALDFALEKIRAFGEALSICLIVPYLFSRIYAFFQAQKSEPVSNKIKPSKPLKSPAPECPIQRLIEEYAQTGLSIYGRFQRFPGYLRDPLVKTLHSKLAKELDDMEIEDPDHTYPYFTHSRYLQAIDALFWEKLKPFAQISQDPKRRYSFDFNNPELLKLLSIFNYNKTDFYKITRFYNEHTQ